jgi:DNA-binding CsgD family transcriptional regulator
MIIYKNTNLKGQAPRDKKMIKSYLTAREQEVGICLIDGMTAKQVSKMLGISVHTVGGHQRKIKKKLKGKTPYQVGCILGKMLECKITDNQQSTILYSP